MRYKADELFKGAAPYYARYRAGYNEAVFNAIIDFFKLDGAGRLLDLGCGTGQLAIPLADKFEAVVALDPSQEMLAEGKRIAREKLITNVTFTQSVAEEIDINPAIAGSFRLATIGTAFHWMDGDAVLSSLDRIVEPHGGVAIITGSKSIWSAPEGSWQQTIKEVVQQFLGAQRKAGKDEFKKPEESFEKIISRSPFSDCTVFTTSWEIIGTLDDVIGVTFSTSYAAPGILGDKKHDFEKVLRERLLKVQPDGIFRSTKNVEVFLMKKS